MEGRVLGVYIFHGTCEEILMNKIELKPVRFLKNWRAEANSLSFFAQTLLEQASYDTKEQW